MRSALLCVFFALIVNQLRCRAVEEDDFRPTPIPLNDWKYDKRGGKAGTLHEIIKTDTPSSVAALPAHYWEDALRHSVYLTLVRDKIDQLIAKGVIVAPDNNHEQHLSKGIDDHDLWEKIKNAPFNRIREQEQPSSGDVQITAKGRLMEDNGGFRFIEDEASTNKCQNDTCAEGVKAFWSVKRVRQREDEASPGKYHYELTFSINSQMPKKKRKPYENPIRTFTMRETEPPKYNHVPRPARAIWFHKNINVPTQRYRNLPNQNLDRIFSSFFTDDDLFDNHPPKYNPNPFPTHMFAPNTKLTHPGTQRDFYHQRKLLPYPYKPHSFRVSRPIPPTPIQHVLHPQNHFLELNFPSNHPHAFPHIDQGYMSSNTVKTTRPAFLPTPVTIPFTKNESIETENIYVTEPTSEKTKPIKEQDAIYQVHPKARPSAIKLNYFPDHVRPPVFNTPPGVFVTMDKKPFKPMPPLKLLHLPKIDIRKPVDFRPSPQVLELQLSNLEISPDSEFRPIALGYEDDVNSNKNISNKVTNKQRLTNKNDKRAKSQTQRTTTDIPEIITAHVDSIDNTETMEYTNIIGAFTKTTPMASHRETSDDVNSNISTTVTPTPEISTSTSIESITTTVTSTTTKSIPIASTSPRPKKRTRPPPKFNRPDKLKKIKRVTSTTAKPTTTELLKTTKSEPDLTPQASTISLINSKQFKKYNKNSTTTVSDERFITTTTTTTLKPLTKLLTTTTSTTTTRNNISTPPSSTTQKEPPITTTQPKRKSRFRQSTLMQKGTSVNHDRWSTTGSEKNRFVPLSKQFPPRRKGSNFQGYLSTIRTTTEDKQIDEEDNQDLDTTSLTPVVTELSTEKSVVMSVSQATQPTYEDTADQYEFNSEATSDYEHANEKDASGIETETNNDEQETKDHIEYIFTETGSVTQSTEKIPTSTEETVLSSTLPAKKKCKKRKLLNSTSTEETLAPLSELTDVNASTVPATSPTTTEKMVTSNIIDELLGAFTFEEPSEKETRDQSTPKPEVEELKNEDIKQYVKSDDNFEEYLGSLNKKENDNRVHDFEYDDDTRDSSDEDESTFFQEEDARPARDTSDYADYQDQPYSLIELMTME